ncbi:hypothetical protein PTKIN_Ptkin03bG0117600 [Pterospermum kingtungense]
MTKNLSSQIPNITEGIVPPASTQNQELSQRQGQKLTAISKLKRRPPQPKSVAWEHFTKFSNDQGEQKAQCNYSAKEFFVDTRKNEDGLGNWKYNYEVVRVALAEMIIIDKEAFKFVDSRGFKHLMAIAFPRFKIPSSHRGEAIGKIIGKCLREWGIYKVFTITIDNDSSNDIAISYLKKKWCNLGKSILGGKYLHMRCIAHTLNLIVVDGLKEISRAISRVRNVVRYIIQSPARFNKLDSSEVGVSCSNTSVRQTVACDESVAAAGFKNCPVTWDKFKKFKESGKEDNKTELDKYLAEDDSKVDDQFYVLLWWKVNSPRYPILSTMARDILAILISTITYESAFSTCGRMLDSYSSSVTPKLVQGLICTQDWLWSASRIDDVEDDLEELEKIDSDLSKIALETTFD